MLENPSTIPQPGSQYSGAMASSSVPSPTASASYAGGYHSGVMNPAYRGASYNSRFNLECNEAWVLTNYARSRLQTQPILRSSTTTWRDEDVGRHVNVQLCTQDLADFGFSNGKSPTFCYHTPQSLRSPHLGKSQSRTLLEGNGLLCWRQYWPTRYCVSSSVRNQGQWRRNQGQPTRPEEQARFYKTCGYHQGASSQDPPIQQ